MKIRNPKIIQAIGFFGACLLRLWMSTISFRYRPQGPGLTPEWPGLKGRYIYVFFHENILLPCHYYARRDIQVLISEHSDGEMIAQVCRHVGFGTIRGSKTRSGTKALFQMIRSSKKNHIAVIPDGPRGPRRHVELGLIYLAAKTGLPLVLLGIGYDRPWRLNTWDRFAIPRPWSRAVMFSRELMTIPADASRAELEAYRVEAERILNELNEQAEHAASR